MSKETFKRIMAGMLVLTMILTFIPFPNGANADESASEEAAVIPDDTQEFTIDPNQVPEGTTEVVSQIPVDTEISTEQTTEISTEITTEAVTEAITEAVTETEVSTEEVSTEVPVTEEAVSETIGTKSGITPMLLKNNTGSDISSIMVVKEKGEVSTELLTTPLVNGETREFYYNFVQGAKDLLAIRVNGETYYIALNDYFATDLSKEVSVERGDVFFIRYTGNSGMAEDTLQASTELNTEAPVQEEETLISFDHIFDTGVSEAQLNSMDFSSKELLAGTDDPSVFTKNTEVVSELDGIYLLRFSSAEETKSAYSYYYNKVDILEVNANVFQTAAEEAGEQDVADLSDLNNGDDALSEASDLNGGSYPNVIALIDTGCSGAGVVNAVSVLGGSASDDNGHGSAMRDTILAEYPEAQILSIKALGADGSAQISDIYAAIKYASDRNVKIINLSIAAFATADSQIVTDAINEASARGIIVVGAAGNQGKNVKYFVPGNISSAIIAGACDENGQKLGLSNYGDTVDYNVKAESTSYASAILSAMIARDGLDNLPVNKGTLFTTDYVATTTDAKTTEVTTENTTEATTEVQTTTESTEEATVGDATSTDADREFEDPFGFFDGLFHTQWPCASYVAVRLGLDGGKFQSVVALKNELLKNQGYEIVWQQGDWDVTGQGSNTMAKKIAEYAQPNDIVLFYRTCKNNWADSDALHCGIINQVNASNNSTTSISENGESANLYNYPTYDYDNFKNTWESGKSDAKQNYSIARWIWTAPRESSNRDKTSHAFMLLRKKPVTPVTGSVRVCKRLSDAFANEMGGAAADIGGAVYGIYSDAGCTQKVGECKIEKRSEEAAGTIHDNVSSSCGNLNGGQTYYVKEIIAPPNYQLDGTVYHFTAIAGRRVTLGMPMKLENNKWVFFDLKALGQTGDEYTYDDTTNPWMINGLEMPQEPTAQIRLCKRFSPKNVDISGAEYTIYADSGLTNKVGVCTFEKDGDNVSNNAKLSSTTTQLVPGHVYYFKETKAPSNGQYALDTTVYHFTAVGGCRLTIGVPFTLNYSNNTYSAKDLKGIQPESNENKYYGYTDWNFENQTMKEEPRDVFLAVTKKTAMENIDCVQGNPNYSLNGAEYTLYTNAACTQVAKDKNNNDVIIKLTANPGEVTTTTKTITLQPKTYPATYWIKETKAPDKGYDVDSNPRSITFTSADIGTTKSETMIEHPLLDPVQIEMQKIDALSKKPVADGAGTLGDAKFTMKFYAVDISNGQTYTREQLAALTPTRQWVFKTIKQSDGKYVMVYDQEHLVSGDELYQINGETRLPQGYITIEETEAPTGYTKEGADLDIPDTMNKENGIVICKTDRIDGKVTVGNIPTDLNIITSEHPLRGDIYIKKLDKDGNPVAGAKFKVTNTGTGEVHYFYTDAKGEYDSTKTAITVNTNAMDTANGYTEAGLWFGKCEDGSMLDPVDGVGSLNSGAYTIEEIRTDAVDGLQIEAPMHITVDQEAVNGVPHKYTIKDDNLQTDQVTDIALPSFTTKAASDSTGDQMLSIAVNESITDTVTYQYLQADTNYALTGKLMVLHKDGSYEEFKKPDGSSYEKTEIKHTEAGYTKSKFEKCGSFTMTFYPVDTTAMKEGDRLVVFETLNLENGGQYAYSNFTQEHLFPMVEDDIHNEAQTLSAPSIHTDAVEAESGSKTVASKKVITVIDTVDMTGLIAGKEYTLIGALHEWVPASGQAFTENADQDADNYEVNTDIYTAEELKAAGYKDNGVLKHADGTPVTGTTTFTAKATDEQQKVTFTFDASLLAGKTVVVEEDLYHNNVRIATHANITDEKQTIHFPQITTSVHNDATLTREVLADGIAHVTDVVAYKNFPADTEYTVYGQLMDRRTGKQVIDADGNPVESKATFKTPKVEQASASDAVADDTQFETLRCDGTVNVEFEFNAEGLDGLDTVVFERAVIGDASPEFEHSATDAGTDIVAFHESLTDKSQTLHFSKIGTTAKGDIETLAQADEKVTITDTVHYENLRPKKEYKVYGELHIKKENEDGTVTDLGVLKDAQGNTVQASEVLTTGEGNNEFGGVDGDIDIKFTFDASLLRGQTVVAFETLTRDDIVVAFHKDIEDEGQTIHFPKAQTSLTDKQTENKITYENKNVTITDTVHYENVIPGREYTVSGVLYVKNKEYVPTATDASFIQTVTDADDPEFGLLDERIPLMVNGHVVRGTASFTPEKSEGDVDVTFTFDATGLGGTTLVAAEKILRNGVVVATHADIKDKAQTSNVPRIHTLALNDVTGTHEAKAAEKANLTDFVYYENLKEKEHYHLYGTLMDKKTGQPVLDKDGNPVVSEARFKVQGTDDLFTNTVYEAGANEEASYTMSAGTGHTVGTAGNEEVKARRAVTDSAVIRYFTNGTSTLTSTKESEVIINNTVGMAETTTVTDAATNSDGTETEINETGGIDGIAEVYFEFDASDLGNHDVVVYEKLYVEKNGEEKIVASHEDITDEGQTIHFPEAGTTAQGDVETLSMADEEATITDAVAYKNLRPEKEYKVYGELHVKHVNEDGTVTDLGVLQDADGNVVKADKTFTTGKANNDLGGVDGSVDIVFTFNASLLAGKTIVAFENITRDNIVVATHSEISDEGQTVHFPKAGTSLTDKQTENKITYAGGNVTITDTIHYENLIPGRTYEAYGVLHVKNKGYVRDELDDVEWASYTDAATNTDAGITVLDNTEGMTELVVNGKVVKGKAEFVPESSEGYVDVTFTFDGTGLGGYTLVAAEKIKRNGVVVAVHADINDKGQTGNIPKIHTLAVNDLTGKHEVKADGVANVTDFVYYENLKEKEKYHLYGTLMNKNTGEVVLGKDGKPVTAEAEFTVQGTEDWFTNTVYTDGKDRTQFYDATSSDAAPENILSLERETETNKETHAICGKCKMDLTKEFGGVETEEARKHVQECSGEETPAEIIMEMVETPATLTDAEQQAQTSKYRFARNKRNVTLADIKAYFKENGDITWSKSLIATIDQNAVGLSATATMTDAASESENTQSTMNETGGVDGIAEVHFTFDASNMDGLDTVVFEELYIVNENGDEKLAADHKDIKDEGQTITFPEIHTTLTDQANGDHKIAQNQTTVTLVDRIEYKNLNVGQEYTVTGTLRVADDRTGKYKDGDCLRYADGSPVTKTVTFTAASETGSVDVVFEISASLIPTAKIVAFEEMKQEGAVVAVHMDINDKNQTVTPPHYTPPKTGVYIFFILIGLLIISGCGMIISGKRHKKQNK